MKESYIKVVDSQHASSELIQLTKQKMREALEEDNNERNTISETKTANHRERNVYNLRKSYRYIGMAAALLIVITIGGVWNISNSIRYEDISSPSMELGGLNFGIKEKGKFEISIEEFNEEFGTNILAVDALGGNSLSNERATITYSDDNNVLGEVIADYEEYTLEISIGEDNILPQLKKAKANSILGVDVYFGYDENNQTCMACFSIDNVFYKVSSEGISKAEFGKAIKEFIKEKLN